MNMSGFIGLAASLRLFRDLGLSAHDSPIADAVLAITRHARRCLLEIGAEVLSPSCEGRDSGILTFRYRDIDAETIRNRCREQGVVVSCRGGGVRISLHGYINEDDIDCLIRVLKSL